MENIQKLEEVHYDRGVKDMQDILLTGAAAQYYIVRASRSIALCSLKLFCTINFLENWYIE